jgi:hypothetical protein
MTASRSAAALIALVASLVLATFTVGGGLAEPMSGSGRCAGRLVSVPSPFGYADVTVTPSGEVWVVGGRKQFEPPMTARWNGSRWQLIPAPDSDSTLQLSSIDFAAPDDGWAVGGSGDDRDVAIHWDGKRWANVQGAAFGSRNVRLFDVAALSSTNVWAVGFSQILGSAAPIALIEHWDGHLWRAVKSPNPGAEHSELGAVVALSADDVWALGSRSTSGHYLPRLIEHWDGHRWTIPTDTVMRRMNAVVALPSGQLLAVGQRGVGPLIEVRDGARWQEMPPPPIVGGLVSVAATSTDNIWVSSAGDRGIAGDFSDPVAHWDGHKWQRLSAPKLGKNRVHVFELVAAPSGDAWAVGFAEGVLKDVVERFGCNP